MKKIIIHSKKHGTMEALVDDEDYDYLMQWKWAICKNHNTFYVGRSEKQTIPGKHRQKSIKMHRAIMKVTDAKTLVDHRNGNGLDNQKANIRVCTHEENVRNSKPFKTGTSKYKGVKRVNRKKNPWVARIFHKGKRVALGSYPTEKQAAEAYNKKALELFGEFAWLNIIQD